MCNEKNCFIGAHHATPFPLLCLVIMAKENAVMEARRLAERNLHRDQSKPARENAKIKSEEAFATLLVPANQRK